MAVVIRELQRVLPGERSFLVQHSHPSVISLHPDRAFYDSSLGKLSFSFLADATGFVKEDDG